MRVTNSLFYTNAANDYQGNMQELYKVNTQISSGLKIQNSFEDSGVYVDTMRLNYEVATLEQVKESSSKAQTYANNTDQVLNQFTDALTQFKTKLLQAANESNSSTSLDALANDLQGLRDHMVSLGNTSINGQYLFAGTAVATKPFNDDGTYNGNNGDIEAIIGAGVKLPYNITGEDLFFGNDNEYNKVLSTNVKLLNQIALNPTSGNSEEIYINETSTIRELVGDVDNDLTNNANPVFYLSGKKSNGETFSTSFAISQTSKMSDLTERIGKEYGNTSTNKVVDVSINNSGQIEIKDLNNGNSILEMNIFGAVNRDPIGNPNAANKTTDIDELLEEPNVDIIAFNKSNFKTTNTATTISSREDINNSGLFRIGYPMTDSDGSYVNESTVLSTFMSSSVDHINVNGTNVDITESVQDLLDEIQTQFGGTARLENGQIIVDSLTSNAILIAEDSSDLKVVGFSTSDAMNYERRGFEKNGNKLSGNISQIIKDTNEYATSKTKLIEVSGTKTFDDISTVGDETHFLLNGIDIDGNSFSVRIDLSNDISVTGEGSTFTTIGKDTDSDGNDDIYTIFDFTGGKTKADNLTYQQLNDVVSMVISGNVPIDKDLPLNGIGFNEYNDALSSSKNSVEVGLNSKGQLEIYDKNNSESKIEFSIFDSHVDNPSTASSLTFMANDAITIEEPKLDFFQNLDEMIEAVRSGTYNMDANSDNPRNIGIQNSIARIDHFIDHITKEHTKIGSYSNALSQAGERAELLSINVQTVRSEVIDVDIGEAYMKFNQLSNSYQAMLSTVAKINSMTLLNYM